jgi:glycerol-3-phosphate dehydrogenase
MGMNREQILESMRRGDVFDVLVIGGGATGCGIALDAASRGLRVALIEKNDFGEGTSSRSTKLFHGGVRYLELAVKNLDRVQFQLVRDALHERGVLLKIAPHLSNRLPLVTPLYAWTEVPYIFAGLKLYDLLAGSMGIGRSRLVGRSDALKRFPMLKADGLKAGVLYYDGQFNDARMAVTLALTALNYGALVANHVEVTALLKEGSNVAGALVKEFFSGAEWAIRARAVVNATGPFVDRVRRLDDPGGAPMLRASSGIHALLDKRFAPPDTGLLIPKTEDGRVLFVLPWEGHSLVGTTDEPAEIEEHPRPTSDEVAYLLRHVNQYFDLHVTREDIKATWSGLRPLIFDPKAVDTARLARDHVLEESASGLLTIAGGKWTTYRKMALDVVDHAIRRRGLEAQSGCRTEQVILMGGEAYRPDGAAALAGAHHLDSDVARHLNRAYGDRSEAVAILSSKGYGGRLAGGHPYIEAEVVHAARHELAEKAIDVLARRTPLGLLNTAAAEAAAPRVIEIMAEELGWDATRREYEAEWVTERLRVAL